MQVWSVSRYQSLYVVYGTVRILHQVIENSAHHFCEFCANSAHFLKLIFPLLNYQWHCYTTLFATLVYLLSLT